MTSKNELSEIAGTLETEVKRILDSRIILSNEAAGQAMMDAAIFGVEIGMKIAVEKFRQEMLGNIK